MIGDNKMNNFTKEEFEPITEENIEEVLQYNGFDIIDYNTFQKDNFVFKYCGCGIYFFAYRKYEIKHNFETVLNFMSGFIILKPLPKKSPIDVKQLLIDNGCTVDEKDFIFKNNKYIGLLSETYIYWTFLEITHENLQIAMEMARLMEKSK